MSSFAGTFVGTLPGLGAVSAMSARGGSRGAGRAVTDPVTLDLRQQIKWLALVGGAFVVCQVALAIAFAIAGNDAVVTTVIGFTSAVLALFGLPVAITVAILQYGLYEIDVIINRAVVYGLLAAVLTASTSRSSPGSARLSATRGSRSSRSQRR